jgi:glycosyltransferase involved in cell wall biosynthesis
MTLNQKRDWSDKNQSHIVFIFSDFDNSVEYLFVLSGLIKLGYSVSIIIIRGHDVTFVKQLRIMGIPIQVIDTSSKLSKLIHLYKLLVKIKKHKRRVILSGVEASYLVYVISFFCSMKYVLVRHHSELHYQLKNRLAIFLDKRIAQKAKRVYAVSNSHRTYLTSHEGIPSEKLHVIYGGFDLGKFTKERRRSTPKTTLLGDTYTKPHFFTFGVCSRLVEWKGIQYIIPAFRKLLQHDVLAELIILGQGPFHSQLEELIDVELAEFVRFVDRTDSMPDFFKSLDVFVHTPISEFSETFGMVYLEALAAGVVCIFTKSGILGELPEIGKSTAVVSYENSEAIFQAMLSITENMDGANFCHYPVHHLDIFTLENLLTRYRDVITYLDSLN